MRLVLTFIFVVFSTLPAQNLTYDLTVTNPSSHIAEVSVTLPTHGQQDILVAMPAWAPGRYVIYNFSKNVFDLSAKDEHGTLLNVRIRDKQSWRIHCPNTSFITIRYSVYAHTLDGTFSYIDRSGASLNGASLFLYPISAKNTPLKLHLHMPAGWQTVCPLKQSQKGIYSAGNYDELVDSPIESGPLFITSFKVMGKRHTLVFHRRMPQALLQSFQRDLKKVIQREAAVFGGVLPYKNYTFFFHLKPNLEHADGMEHRNSCRVLLRMNPEQVQPNANSDPDYDNLIWLSAHEFFHTWNIKRLYPKGLGPFDYSKETYTPALWIVEGLTSYYAYLSLIRSGIYSAEKLYSELAGRIRRYESNPGKRRRSLTEVSMLTWLFKGHVPQYEATNIDTTTYSYYYKGLIVGLLLDFKIRSATNGAFSLDEVMQKMFKKFGQDLNYAYRPGSGYTLNDFETIAETTTGTELNAFFETSVHRVQPLDYSALRKAGLQLLRNKDEFVIETSPKATAEELNLLQHWLMGN